MNAWPAFGQFGFALGIEADPCGFMDKCVVYRFGHIMHGACDPEWSMYHEGKPLALRLADEK